MTPRTLDALRSAVGRVLVARGEAPDALRVTHIRIGHSSVVRIVAVVVGVEVEWICREDMSRSSAFGSAWRFLVSALEYEVSVARRSGAGIRRPERRAAAYQRIMRATAALAAARAVEVGE